MKALAYDIYLEQPVLATSLVGDPNSTVTYDYIPGSTLRGLFVQRYLQAKQQANGADDATFQRLFLAGAVRYLHAYPLTSANTRALPTPASLRQRKGDTGDTFMLQNMHPGNPAAATSPQSADQGQAKPRWMPVKSPFWTMAHGNLELLAPERTLAVHVQRDRPKGRAWIARNADNTETAHGTVFCYEALAAGQWFTGVVLADATDDMSFLQDLVSPTANSDNPVICWLGRSRSATYGKVQVTNGRIVDGWHEAVPDTNPTPSVWTMTLLSDTLLRDRDGNFVELVDDATLSAYLGVPVTLDPEHTFVNRTLVGGFNRTWGLPLIQGRALAAGSVISFTPVSGTLDTTALEAVGVGERCAEGFGRVAFNWLGQAQYQARKGSLPRQPPAVTPADDPARSRKSANGPLPPAAQKLAIAMAERLFDQQIDRAIVTFVQDQVWPQVTATHDQMPTNSQLARLRVLVRRAQLTGDTTLVKDEFARFRPFARQGYERARLDKKPESLDVWVTRLLTDPGRVWEELGHPQGKPVAGYHATPADQHAQALQDRRVTLRLLSAVLAAPAQRRKRTSPAQSQETKA